MLIKFHELPLGARFEFRGRRYQKLALSLARDEDRCGNVFLGETEVLPEGSPAIARTYVAECARPRAQQCPTASTRPHMANPPDNSIVAVAGDGHAPEPT